MQRRWMPYSKVAIIWMGLLLMANGAWCQGKSKPAPPANSSTKDSLDRVIQQMLDSLKDEDLFKEDVREFAQFLKSNRRDIADSILDIVPKHSHLEIGLDLTSRVIYDGRVFSSNAVTLMPSIRYKHKWGFYAEIATFHNLPYDSVFKEAIDQVNLTAGFSHKIIRRWYVNVNYTHWFITYGRTTLRVPYNGGSIQFNPRTMLDNAASLSTCYNFFNYVIASVDFSFMWGAPQHIYHLAKEVGTRRETATTLNFQLSKDFPIYILSKKLNSVLYIGPQVIAACGSDNTFKRVNTPALNLRGKKTSFEEVSFWGLLDVEPSVNIEWQFRNFDFIVSPRLAIPFNVDTDVRDNKPGTPVFYVAAGVRYMFRVAPKK